MAFFKEKAGGVYPCSPLRERCKKAHVGLGAIRDFVERSRFKLVICGHVHEGSGVALLAILWW